VVMWLFKEVRTNGIVTDYDSLLIAQSSPSRRARREGE
jgi:hypothetical protein